MGTAKHIGIICEPSPSHIHSAGAIGRELLKRGHHLTAFHVPEVAASWNAEDIAFRALVPPRPDFVQNHLNRIRSQKGASIRNFLDYAIQSASIFCEQAPEALRRPRVDLVLADMTEPGGATAAEAAGVPHVTFCSALPLHTDPCIPPDFLPWRHRRAWWATLRNQFGYLARDVAIAPLHRSLNRFRRLYRLPEYRRPEDSGSRLAQVSQLVAEFDLPRTTLPNCFHYLGPYLRGSKHMGCFPFSRLDGRPVVYCCLGSFLDGTHTIWRTIAESCAALGVQLVLSLSGQEIPRCLEELPGNAIVVSFAPQRKLIALASAVISHGGLNSAMEAIAEGKPLLVIPITNDQFGVAARVDWGELGRVLPLDQARTDTLTPALEEVWKSSRFREKAEAMRKAVAATGGAPVAADIVEQVLRTGKPVLRTAPR